MDRTLPVAERHSKRSCQRLEVQKTDMKRILTTAALVGAITCLALAQGGGGQGRGQGQGFPGGGRAMMGGGGGQTGLNLLRRKDVATDLKLSTEQTAKVDALVKKTDEERRARMEERRNGGGGGQNFDPETFRAEQQKQQEAQKKEIAGILTPEQVKRLGEIEVQLQGTRALMNPEVQKKLAITDDQKTKLQQAQQSSGQKMRDMMEDMRSGGGQPDQEKMRQAMTEMQKSVETEMMKVLTEKQKTEFEALKGKPFKADPNENRRRGGGGIIG